MVGTVMAPRVYLESHVLTSASDTVRVHHISDFIILVREREGSKKGPGFLT